MEKICENKAKQNNHLLSLVTKHEVREEGDQVVRKFRNWRVRFHNFPPLPLGRKNAFFSQTFSASTRENVVS